jgi:hypothetical protein
MFGMECLFALWEPIRNMTRSRILNIFEVHYETEAC